MTLVINGQTRTFAHGALTLPELLGELALDRIPVIVEHNSEPLLPSQHADTSLRDGDRLEIVRVVAGG